MRTPSSRLRSRSSSFVVVSSSVRRLELFFRSLQLFVRALELFVRRQHFLVRGLQFVLRRFVLLQSRLQKLPQLQVLAFNLSDPAILVRLGKCLCRRAPFFAMRRPPRELSSSRIRGNKVRRPPEGCGITLEIDFAEPFDDLGPRDAPPCPAHAPRESPVEPPAAARAARFARDSGSARRWRVARYGAVRLGNCRMFNDSSTRIPAREHIEPAAADPRWRCAPSAPARLRPVPSARQESPAK